MMKVAFDVDGTLIDHRDYVRPEIVDLYKALQKLGCEMYIWSHGGVDYAEIWRSRLHLLGKVVEKGSFKPDIAVDDQKCAFLGKVDLHVGGSVMTMGPQKPMEGP